MCQSGFLASPWTFLLGGGIEFLGVALLIRGLSTTRKSFDAEWTGIPTWLSAKGKSGVASLSSEIRSLWRRLFRRPQVIKGQAVAVGTLSEANALGEVRSKKTPPWDALDPMEAIERVHAILYEERDRLLDRIRDSEKNQREAVAEEAESRARGDDSVRADVLQLALGGLAQEAWATVLILAGIIVTTAAGVCSLL